MAEDHHQAGQDARGRGEADQRLEEQGHDASPEQLALYQGPPATPDTAKLAAPHVPAVCFGVIARMQVECFKTRPLEIWTTLRRVQRPVECRVSRLSMVLMGRDESEDRNRNSGECAPRAAGAQFGGITLESGPAEARNALV